MNKNTAVVIARRRIVETCIGPGFYISLCIGLLMGYFLVSGFIQSIDSSGFDFAAHPLYDLIVRILHGAFGAAFLEKLFAEGPYLLTLIVSFAPVLIYLSTNSIFKFGFEKKVGAIELLVYGPVSGRDYFLGFLIKDLCFTLLSLVVIFVFLLVSAAVSNLLLGPVMIYTLVFLFFLSISIYAYGILASAITGGSASAIILFLGSMLFLLGILMGSFTVVSSYANSLADVLSWIFQWISPFFYLDMGMTSLHAGTNAGYWVGILCLSVLSFLVLLLSSLIMKVRGVRA